MPSRFEGVSPEEYGRRAGILGQRRYPVLNLGQNVPPAAVDGFAGEYMGKWGIVGVGEGYRNGRPVLEVLTTSDEKVVAALLPKNYMGFEVAVIRSGEIRPQ